MDWRRWDYLHSQSINEVSQAYFRSEDLSYVRPRTFTEYTTIGDTRTFIELPAKPNLTRDWRVAYLVYPGQRAVMP